MKKIFALVMILTITCSLTACGSKEDISKNTAVNGDGSQSDSVSEENEVMEYEELYGTITSVVGNEIELALVKMPEVEEPSEEEIEGADELPATTDAVLMTPASESTASVDEGENVEYTGENLTITIPAGVTIYSMGQESTMSAVKKGSLVSVAVDNKEDMNVQSVRVLE